MQNFHFFYASLTNIIMTLVNMTFKYLRFLYETKVNKYILLTY